MNRFRLAVVAICFTPVLSAQAQDKSSVDLRATFGVRNAIIEGTCSSGGGQPMGGASIRYHATEWVSVGPEVLFVRACDRQTFTFYHPQMSGLLQVAVDVGQSRRIRPYVIAGFGFVRHRSFAGDSLYRMEAAGGGGTKIFLSDRVFLAPEIQAGGSVAFLRFTGSFGILLR